jgi:hypothetical protein
MTGERLNPLTIANMGVRRVLLAFIAQLEKDTRADERGKRDKQFLETNIPALIEEMKDDAEEYGQLHNEECGVNREDICDCENMELIKSFGKEWMGKVNEWWVIHATAHRKHCSPEGNKILTRLMGKKNRNRKSPLQPVAPKEETKEE